MKALTDARKVKNKSKHSCKYYSFVRVHPPGKNELENNVFI